MDVAARDKIVAARTNLLVSNGFFGFLALHLNIVEVTEGMAKANPMMKTMAVDGKNMYYWPAFVHKLTTRELEGVVAHEIMHCCFMHFSRRQHRDPIGWNIAGDFVINLELTESGFVLPKSALLDPKYKGLNTEEVYERLPKIEIFLKGIGDGEDPGGCGAVLDAPGEQSDKDEMARSWETSVRSALEIAKADSAGKLPGSLKELINQLNQPKVSWRDLTRRWIDQSLTKDVSWSRLSRRSLAVGVPLPGLISDRLQHLVCFCDTSGSISFEMITEFISECAGALDQGTADRMTVVYADTAVQHVDEYYAGDIVEAGEYHGGGTDFRASFEWLKQNAPDASAVIYFTDLEVNEFGEEPNCPVLWAVYSSYNNYIHLAERPPFGETICVSNQVG